MAIRLKCENDIVGNAGSAVSINILYKIIK
jgi:hypothetical protein